MTAHDAVATIAGRLAADGQQVTTEQLPGGSVTVGYRGDFRLRWMATKLNLFTVVLAVPVVTADDLRRFSDDALEFAVQRKGGARGLQTGVAAIPILIGDVVDPAAEALARDTIVKRWAAFAWPAVQLAATGQHYSHEGRVVIGGVYAGWMRKQTGVAFGVG